MIKVLLVEDNKMLLEILGKVCRENLDAPQIRAVETVKDAKAAIEEGFVPDLVISDGQLPDGLGPSLFGLYREANPGVFIFFSTTMDRDKVSGMLPAHERNLFLPKPLMPSTLIPLVIRVQGQIRP